MIAVISFHGVMVGSCWGLVGGACVCGIDYYDTRTDIMVGCRVLLSGRCGSWRDFRYYLRVPTYDFIMKRELSRQGKNRYEFLNR